uniref:Secreted protein n=1 Tax=Schistosoma curassoni TaxID=6186 RepID=A0A183KP92_9TREM
MCKLNELTAFIAELLPTILATRLVWCDFNHIDFGVGVCVPTADLTVLEVFLVSYQILVHKLFSKSSDGLSFAFREL